MPSSTALTSFDHPGLEDLKRRIDGARLSAARAVNRELVGLYWDIGQAIREQQTRCGWGDAAVDRLARDLKAPFAATAEFSAESLWRMRQFHETCAAPEFLAQLVREMVETMPWGHHVNLPSKRDDPAKRLFYLKATARFGWNRNGHLPEERIGTSIGSAQLKRNAIDATLHKPPARARSRPTFTLTTLARRHRPTSLPTCIFSVFGKPNIGTAAWNRSRQPAVPGRSSDIAPTWPPGAMSLTRTPYSRNVKTTDRYETGPEWMASMPCNAVASNSSESPAPTSTTFPP
ncbi:putative nuclease of restriction endonuclease-like (RecB) superfamily [Variovorax boronicumulans]|nr:putative nuclease of restriction endonuclease-like (RecB) superfamily [Variovorax boronicumulans]